MKYTQKDIEDYYNGNDVIFNIDEAENNQEFIYELLKYIIEVKKDIEEAKNYYNNYFLDVIKGDYKTIKFLLENLSSDINFVHLVGGNYVDAEPENDVEYFEIAIILSNLLKSHPNQLIRAEFASIAYGFYICEKGIIEKAQEKDPQTNYGHGFFLVKKEYIENPTIAKYIAQNMVNEILYPDNNRNHLENLLHDEYKTPDFEINKFLLNYLYKHDSRLADYINPLIPQGFFDFVKNDIDLIKNNWQNYLKVSIKRKRNCIIDFCYKFGEKHRSVFENNGSFYGTDDIFNEIVTKYNKNELFNVAPTPSLPSNPNMTDDEKLFRKTLEYLMQEAFKKNTFDPNLFVFMEFDNTNKIVSIFDADLMYDEKPPKRG